MDRPRGPLTPAAVLAPLRGHLLSVGLFSAAMNLLMLAPALYMLQVYDRVLTSGNEATLLVLTLLVMGLLLLMSLLEWVRSRMLVRLGQALETGLGEAVFHAAFRAALAAESERRPFRWLATLRGFLSSQAVAALFDAPWIPFYLAVIFLLHPAVGWLAVVAATVLWMLAWVGERRTGPLLRQAGREHEKLAQALSDTLANAEVVEALGMADALRRRWLARREALQSLQTLAADRGGTLRSATRFLRVAVQSLVLGLGAWLVLRGELSGGGMIAASILLGRALAPVEQLIGHWRQWVEARDAWQSLERFLARHPRRPPGLGLPAPRGRLELHEVVVAPPGREKPVLEGVGLELAPGTALGVVGPSAAGKSALARVLVGVWRPTEGEVRLDGARIADWNRDELGRWIGYLPQDVELFAGTVAENIARFGPVEPKAVVRAARRAGVHEMILRLPQGYDTVIGPGGWVLSAGQRQRIGLARALFGDPRLIVLDEPDASLDEAGEAALVKAVVQAKRAGRTLVVVSHRARILEAVDRVLVLRDGRAVAQGVPRRDAVDGMRAPRAAGGERS